VTESPPNNASGGYCVGSAPGKVGQLRLFAVEGVTVVGAGAALLLVGLPSWFGVEEVGGEGCGDRFA
jgi:hypothetical protein